MILLYPVIVYDPAIPRARENLIGKTPDSKALHLYGTENHLTSNTPPTFLESGNAHRTRWWAWIWSVRS